MIRTFLDFTVRAGHAHQLITLFERHGILDRSVAQSGCTSAELSVSRDGERATVTATWESMVAYEQWTARADRHQLTQEINVHLDRPIDAATVGRIQRIAISRRGPSHEPGEES